MGRPPNMNIIKTTTIIPNMMTGIKKRNTASTMMAKAATTNRANNGPSKAITAIYHLLPGMTIGGGNHKN